MKKYDFKNMSIPDIEKAILELSQIRIPLS